MRTGLEVLLDTLPGGYEAFGALGGLHRRMLKLETRLMTWISNLDSRPPGPRAAFDRVVSRTMCDFADFLNFAPYQYSPSIDARDEAQAQATCDSIEAYLDLFEQTLPLRGGSLDEWNALQNMMPALWSKRAVFDAIKDRWSCEHSHKGDRAATHE